MNNIVILYKSSHFEFLDLRSTGNCYYPMGVTERNSCFGCRLNGSRPIVCPSVRSWRVITRRVSLLKECLAILHDRSISVGKPLESNVDVSYVFFSVFSKIKSLERYLSRSAKKGIFSKRRLITFSSCSCCFFILENNVWTKHRWRCYK